MKCLIIDVVSGAIGEELGKYMEVTVSEKLPPSKEELKAQIADVDVLIMRVDPKIDQEVLDAAKNLKVDLGVYTHDQHVHISNLSLQLFLAGGQLLADGDFHVLAQFLADGAADDVDNQTLHGNLHPF